MKNSAKILIKSATKNLKLVREFIEDRAKEYNINENIIDQIVISVDEACTNIIKHTHKYNDNKFIDIETSYTPNQFIVTINYNGKAFDPTKKEVPDMKEYFEKYKVGGLGIPLIVKSMDKIEFNHKKPDKNSLVLIKNI